MADGPDSRSELSAGLKPVRVDIDPCWTAGVLAGCSPFDDFGQTDIEAA